MDDYLRCLKELIEETRKLRQEVYNLSQEVKKIEDINYEVREFKKMYDKRSWK